ncbi:MAG: hydroxyethylthiazole kinase [Ruminiclostridium sp.]|nr:hydroxyethylthiazole kinase [Ruminiclostridium sp.]
MTRLEISNIRKILMEKNPLIHCITNPISINECANTILAFHGRPMMAEHPLEAEEITRTACAVLLNIGNITDARISSIRLSARCCKENHIPFVLDIVGMACSSLRRDFVKKLLENSIPAVIKGNYSELMALYTDYTSSGVDSEAIDIAQLDRVCKELATRYGTVILASGKTDIVTDGKRLFHVNNGTVQLSYVTGTGCMQGALCAVLMATEMPLDAALKSALVMGICGELACTEKGSGSFMVTLMDKLSTIDDKEFNRNIKMEEISLEF